VNDQIRKESDEDEKIVYIRIDRNDDRNPYSVRECTGGKEVQHRLLFRQFQNTVPGGDNECLRG
jgi:hypothetical protein